MCPMLPFHGSWSVEPNDASALRIVGRHLAEVHLVRQHVIFSRVVVMFRGHAKPIAKVEPVSRPLNGRNHHGLRVVLTHVVRRCDGKDAASEPSQKTCAPDTHRSFRDARSKKQRTSGGPHREVWFLRILWQSHKCDYRGDVLGLSFCGRRHTRSWPLRLVRTGRSPVAVASCCELASVTTMHAQLRRSAFRTAIACLGSEARSGCPRLRQPVYFDRTPRRWGMSEVAAPDLPVSARVIQVEAQADHLNSLARAKPINALAELIWNALDAYADVVHINVADNELNTPTHIEIVDNGLGIQLSDAERAFGNLGGSLQQREGSASK
ncbi:hypothetical protein RAMLITH_12340 [Ramlibacter sp. RBP-2]|uniref:Histidine kinase/HSP90-like ATPase domain-containing protein n=2 Tax=Ramlibacter lithotrophicus TaxID=2606681 RepID=A0A7X6DGA3_9BURK|nr:hypothetical protein [Ramlibacter lithotrophicus]